jgi:eukaryotic-like serine/threonine-protein kinase
MRRFPPWWVYPCAAAFVAYFVLLVYCDVRRPVADGMKLSAVPGRDGLLVRDVSPGSPAAGAGILAGDLVVRADGQVLSARFDYDCVLMNLRFGRPLKLEVARGDGHRHVEWIVEREPWELWHREGLELLLSRLVQFVTLTLGLVVVFRRPFDFGARLGGWLLATFGVFCIAYPGGLADVWGTLPRFVGLALWLPFCSALALPALLLSFFMSFPRRLLRAGMLWLAIWVPALAVVAGHLVFFTSAVYRPDEPRHLPGWVEWRWVVWAAYLAAAAVVAVVSYRRSDPTERRRIGVMVLGGGIGGAAGWPVALAYWRGSESALFASPAIAVGVLMLLAVPLAFAYAILRHRLFDVRLIIRQGVRYALARRLLYSLVPLALLAMAADIYRNRDRAVEELFVIRAPIYLAIAAAAGVAQWRRQAWLDALDRRFFRERYDAQRVLRRVVEELHRASDVGAAAARVVEQIEVALHPSFVSVLTRSTGSEVYRVAASAPAGAGPAELSGGEKLFALARVLAKPLDVSPSRAAWLAGNLPPDDARLVVSAGLELVVPVDVWGGGTETILVLGALRSDEPYTADDQELLWTIARSLGMVGGRPNGEVPVAGFGECPRCGTCFDRTSGQCPSDDRALVPVGLPRLLAGRYRIDKRLGRGGMGVVYAAADLSLDRSVAVKVLREELVGDADTAGRFEREARIAARFVHPNVVTVFDFGVLSGSRAFLVMERLEGQTLREALAEHGRMESGRVLAILRGVCAAVDAAHRQNLVHRDLKPENVFLARVDRAESPKILDFGIAKMLGDGRRDAAGETSAGVILGTPQYMAPEQWRGEPLQPSWDVWALAVMACEMLTGSHPFASLGIGLTGAGVPTAQPMVGRDAGLEPAWQAHFTRWLSAEPADRPASASVFLGEIEAMLTARQA